ncbi:YEATS-associated helix-containing protein [Flavobacterium sp. P21]|uniref:YEATS-associated helix-containing protein n=1 Tax=Flavobacterium sp. P21 TaxID=3423948 RepID=UPI003D66C235
MSIMLLAGAFGGFLNYLNNFDTVEESKNSKLAISKYIFLGIGAAFLVPLFLKMIASNLITIVNKYDNCNYLIFTGFCLIAAIFSRKFITTLGEKILETAKRAEKIASESKQESKTTQLELNNTLDRIEDANLAIHINTRKEAIAPAKNPEKELYNLVNSYIIKTSIPDYTERLKLKAEFGRKMGEIIITNGLPKEKLLNESKDEGMFLALAYSVQLSPDVNGLSILNKLSPKVSQLYTKYAILLGYKTLARNGFIIREDVKSIYNIIIKFKETADKPLLRNIDETITVLKFIDQNIE